METKSILKLRVKIKLVVHKNIWMQCALDNMTTCNMQCMNSSMSRVIAKHSGFTFRLIYTIKFPWNRICPLSSCFNIAKTHKHVIHPLTGYW